MVLPFHAFGSLVELAVAGEHIEKRRPRQLCT
jgi:hypothetical protein